MRAIDGTTSTAVLIAGAGPTGLTLACSLARQGIPVRVVDQASEPHRHSRGKGLNPRSLEVLADFGLAERLLAVGRTHLPFRKYFDGAFVSESDPVAGSGPTPEVPFDSPLTLPQWRVEGALRELLGSYGVEVEHGRELTGFEQSFEQGFEQSEEGVRAVLADGEQIEAAYLVGCDGARGAVRKGLGVAFVGSHDPSVSMVCGDVEVEGLDPKVWHQWFTAEGGVLLCPFEGSPLWQFQAPPERGPGGAELPASEESFRRLFATYAGEQPGVRLGRVGWLSTWRCNVRLAERLQVGRVLLAGDAAHVQPIAGGLGMNTGIQEAFNLGWKLGYVLSGRAGPGLVDSYQEERLPVAAQAVDLSAELLGTVLAAVRTPGQGLEAGRATGLDGLGVHYRWSPLARDALGAAVQAGDRAPDGVLIGPEGPVRLSALLAGDDFTLLCFDAEAPELPAWARAVPVDHRSDPGGRLRTAYGLAGHGPALVLVRPDNHLALTAPGTEPEAVTGYLARLGRRLPDGGA
ncbi:FAD-dependent monooxygenase [Kitasatospora sp. NPDC002227]|uniref:FAD-dependent monooxygenase n=1 Tax=Kitasatospora sp. NPDC002227 TaxID=3154773 RepID=UPI00332A791F